MVHRYGFEDVAQLMRQLWSNEKLLFGGCTILILGDLRQTLSVLPKASRQQIVDTCLTRSKVWKHFKKITLTQNLRVLSIQSVEDREDLQNFCDHLIKMGDGKLKTDVTGAIQIPKRFLLPPNNSTELLK